MTATDLIDRFICHLRDIGRSDRTTREWGRLLVRIDQQLPHGLDQADDGEIIRWLGRPGWSASTRATYFTALSSFYRWACRAHDRWLESDPMEHVPRYSAPRGAPRPCSDEELARILTEARAPVRLWATLAAYAGLRCIEIGRLHREHASESQMRIHGKGGKWRVVPTSPLIWDAVRDLPAGPIAGGRDGRCISRVAVEYLHAPPERGGLGMPDMGLHRLRHWCLTQIQRMHGDIRLTQEIAGHSSPATTARYTMVADERREQAIRGLPAVGPAGSAAAAGGSAHPPH